MGNMFTIRPTFFASYRDVYDALNSARLRVGNEFMHDFLRSRGIIIGNSSSREELIHEIASYAYDSNDLNELCDQLEIHSKNDRMSYTRLNKNVQREEIGEALEAVKTERLGNKELIDFDDEEETTGRMTIKVKYYDVDESRTILRQNKPMEGKIEFIKVGDEIRVRHPGTDRIKEIADSLIEEIKKKDKDVVQNYIDLSSLNKLERTEFFKILISSLENNISYDVRKVNVEKEIEGAHFDSDTDSDTESDEDDDEGSESEKDAQKRQIENEVKSILKQASLAGSGILRAATLKKFLKSGFFISRIVWVIKPTKKNGDPMAEVEALLQNPAAGTGFKYNVRGVYSLKRDKSYAATKRKATEVEREKILDLLEKASQIALSKVLSNSTKGKK